MSREVLDEGPSLDGATGLGDVLGRSDVHSLSDVRGLADAWGPDAAPSLDDDPPDGPDGDPAGPAPAVQTLPRQRDPRSRLVLPRIGRVGISGPRIGGSGTDSGRPGVRLPVVAGLVVAAAVLGLVLGGWQAQLDARRSSQASTRILLWTSTLQSTASYGVGATSFVATAEPLGGTVLVHELRTPYGVIPYSPDVALTPGRGQDLPVRFRPDCTSYGQWQDDLAKAPRTLTAMVRDLPADPLREVQVDVTGDFMIALVGIPCPQQAQTQTFPLTSTATPAPAPDASPDLVLVDPSATPAATAAGPPALADVTGMTASNTTGELKVDVTFGGAGSGHPIQIALQVAAGVRGFAPGKFELVGGGPVTGGIDRPGNGFSFFVDLVYGCTSGTKTQVADPGGVLQLTAIDAVTGKPVQVIGWSPTVVTRAVFGATKAAGCPISS